MIQKSGSAHCVLVKKFTPWALYADPVLSPSFVSNYVVPLCHYGYSCGVVSDILLHLERFLTINHYIIIIIVVDLSVNGP